MILHPRTEPEITLGIRRTQGPSQALERTLEHVKRGGVPANVEVLSQVRAGIKDGSLLRDRAALATNLRSDPALFTHYLKHLYTSGIDSQTHPDPFEALSALEEEKLVGIFDVAADQISTHLLNRSNRAQAMRLQHTLLSAHSAEVIATKNGIGAGLAYSSATLRQLALNLIAWNYPTIYSKALAAHRSKGVDLIMELQRQLGVSPLQIVSRLMADWNLSTQVRRSVIAEPSEQAKLQSAVTQSKDLSLDQVCELAELYAKSHDRANFPEEESKWRAMEPALKERFGSNFLEEIEHEIMQSVSRYQESAPAVFTAPYLAQTAAIEQIPEQDKTSLRANHFAQRCEAPLREALAKAYSQIKPGAVSVEAIKHLVDRAFTHSGALRGCLYLTSKDGTTLRPTLRMGDMPLAAYPLYDHKDYHPVVDCLVASVPIKWHGTGVRGSEIEIVCGSLGALRHPGVLYLEFSELSSQRDLNHLLTVFHAFRKSFLDFLADGGE